MNERNTLKVILDRPSATYCCGESLCGRVEVHLADQMEMRGISIKYKGKAKVSWRGSITRRRHEAKELFMDVEGHLGSESGMEMVLPAGKHAFPFTMILPSDLPNSYESNYGCIRYTIGAKMDPVWKTHMETKMVFTVVHHFDLNNEPELKAPVVVSGEKYICCLCCATGPISLTAMLPCTGFTVGQEIPMRVELSNVTARFLDVKCEIVQSIKYTAKKHSKRESITQCSMVIGRVGPFSAGLWSAKLRVPILPQSFLQPCTLIDIQYKFNVIAVPPGVIRNLPVSIPIVIGTIPLKENGLQE